MSEPWTSAAEGQQDLASFLRRRRTDIVAEWGRAVEAVAHGADGTLPKLRDFVPGLLDQAAEIVEGARDARYSPKDAATRHAIDKLEVGFDLSDVVVELSLLRSCILRLWEQKESASPDRVQQRFLSQAVDRAILGAVDAYVDARDRMVRALDRISTQAMADGDFDVLLERLISVFQEEAPAVDSVAVFVREDDDVLRVRAATGLAADAMRGRTLGWGEGLAGRVAAEGRPLQISRDDARPFEDPAWDPGVRVLCAVPLMDGDLLGVVQMGSCCVTQFSDQDRLFLSSTASRATAAVYQHRLKAAAERRTRDLAESEGRFRSTFENAAVGIAHLGLDGTWLRLNARYEEILGYPREELLRRRFQDVVHPEDLEDSFASLQRLLAGQCSTCTFEKRYIRKEGNIAWVEASVSLLRDEAGKPQYFIAFAQEVTEERVVRERTAFLSEASALLASTLDYEKTLDQVVRLAVPTIADWCAVDVMPDDGMLREPLAVAHRDPAKVALVHELRRRYPSPLGGTSGIARVLRTGEPLLVPNVHDGMLRRAAFDPEHLDLIRGLGLRSLLVAPLVIGGRAFGALTFGHSESGRRFTKDDLPFAEELAARASVALENARLHAEVHRSVQLRDQILAIVSHDLRNPLAVIDMGCAALVRRPGVLDDPAVQSKLELIRRNARRMSRLIHDLVDMSSLQAGKLTLELEECALGPLLDEAVEAQEPVARDRGIALRLDGDLSGRFVGCDRDRLLQVLGNLLGNALKFCDEGDLVKLRAEVRGREALISVIDTGPGIPADDLPHVFDLYWHGRRRAGGTGLGLFISKGIVEAHGGRMWVESEEGVGSAFYLTLPLVEPPS